MKRIKKWFKRSNDEISHEQLTSLYCSVYEHKVVCNRKVWKVNSADRKGRYYRMK